MTKLCNYYSLKHAIQKALNYNNSNKRTLKFNLNKASELGAECVYERCN